MSASKFLILVAASAIALTVNGQGMTGDSNTTAKESDSPRCAVWRREASFAATVARHDAQAFRAHLADGAVFVNGRPPHFEGERAVMEGWSGIIEGKPLTLRWHPEYVAIGGDGRTAISRGPYTMENADVNPDDRFRIGVFQSVWVKGDDEVWRVMFDGGGPAPRPATEAEAKSLQASWTDVCPYESVNANQGVAEE